MIRSPLGLLGVLGLVLAGLVLLDRSFADARGAGETNAIDELLDADQRARVGARVAAVKLRHPGDERAHLFARVRGEWRCMTLAGAPAGTRAIQDVVDELFAARGLVMVEAGADDAPRDFGLDELHGYELSFHGTQVVSAPDADTLLAVRVGRAVDAGPGSPTFARVVGEGRSAGPILALDRDLVRQLAPNERTGLPAFLDPHVVPAAWTTRAEGPRRIRVERLGAPPYTLELEGERWFLDAGDGERRECHRLLARGYTLFLARIPFAAVLPKSAAATLGLETPSGRVTITPVEGDDLVLSLGDATATPRGSGVAVGNGETGNTFAIGPELVPLLLPEPEALVDPARGNPWDPYLRGR